MSKSSTLKKRLAPVPPLSRVLRLHPQFRLLYKGSVREKLLQTKLNIPAARKSLVPQLRLWERLEAGLDGRLTLVSAPAGFGKTTLVVDWAGQKAETEDGFVA